jgi:hypothetical protein
MATQAIVINEIEWRTDATTAKAGKAFSAVVQHGARHLVVLSSIRDVTIAMNELRERFHLKSSICALEEAQDVQREQLGRKIRYAVDKVHMLLSATKAAPMGKYWKRFYAPRLAALESVNRELRVHCDAMLDLDSAVVFLSKSDQDFVLESVNNPKEPSEALLQVFARK